MKTDLTPEQIDQYQHDGFLAVPGFLDASELAEWRDAVQRAVDERLQKLNGWTNQKPDDMSQYYAKVFTQCVRLADTSPGGVPQRPDRSRRRREYDERLSSRDDVRLHAGRRNLQRAEEHPAR